MLNCVTLLHLDGTLNKTTSTYGCWLKIIIIQYVKKTCNKLEFTVISNFSHTSIGIVPTFAIDRSAPGISTYHNQRTENDQNQDYVQMYIIT